MVDLSTNLILRRTYYNKYSTANKSFRVASLIYKNRMLKRSLKYSERLWFLFAGIFWNKILNFYNCINNSAYKLVARRDNFAY